MISDHLLQITVKDEEGKTNILPADIIPGDDGSDGEIMEEFFVKNEHEQSVSASSQIIEQKYEYKRSLLAWDHLLWLFFLGFAIYNYITDLLVANDWSNFEILCPNFRQIDGQCEQSQFAQAGNLLLVITAIGFLFALITKIYQFYIFIMILKHSKSQQDQENFEFRLFRFDLYSSWIPLIIEDIGSLTIITNTLSVSAISAKGIDPGLVELSLIITGFNILFNYLNFMRQLCIKQKKVKANMDKLLTNCGKCLSYFCFIFWIIMGIGLIIAIVNAFIEVNTIYEAADRDEIGGSDAFVYIEMGKTGECEAAKQFEEYEFNDRDEDDNYGFIQLPQIISTYAKELNCNASDYSFEPECRMLYDDADGGNNHRLNCTLDYEYNGIDDSSEDDDDEESNHIIHCGNLPTLNNCSNFIVQFPFRGNYSIPCNFTEGNLTFYACFDYCYYDYDL